MNSSAMHSCNVVNVYVSNIAKTTAALICKWVSSIT